MGKYLYEGPYGLYKMVFKGLLKGSWGVPAVDDINSCLNFIYQNPSKYGSEVHVGGGRRSTINRVHILEAAK